jgi:hypothetical protein
VKKRYFGCNSNTLPENSGQTRSGIKTKIKEVQVNAQNLSTQKASEKEGARLQKENGYRRRQKRTEEKTRKRQKKIDLLIGQTLV